MAMPEPSPVLSPRRMGAPCVGSCFRRGFNSEDDRHVSRSSDHRGNASSGHNLQLVSQMVLGRARVQACPYEPHKHWALAPEVSHSRCLRSICETSTSRVTILAIVTAYERRDARILARGPGAML